MQTSVIPLYKNFIANYPSLQILVYSGDVDAIVPYWGTRTWVLSLNNPIKEQWRPWLDYGEQVGGFVEVHNGFTFATVRNAGHMVPFYQPERGWIMYSSFFNG